ncbi:preprotein translocase subunit SecE, partial [Myxococcota bacterium]
AAFCAAAVLGAFLAGRILTAVWNRLAEWPPAVRAVPALLRYGELERVNVGLVGGAVIGLVVLWRVYHRRDVRQWADEVALELSRVTWPNREQVTNGTVVVLVASAVATIYVALLDRFWGFVTTLVYGA